MKRSTIAVERCARRRLDSDRGFAETSKVRPAGRDRFAFPATPEGTIDRLTSLIDRDLTDVDIAVLPLSRGVRP